MEKDTHITEVMFRYDNYNGFYDRVFAVMPYEVERNGNVTTYQHVGQHSTGDYNVCLQQSRPATEAEFADLKKEMENLGYNLKVVKKRNYDKYLKSYYEARGIVNNLLAD
jgi:hypothetical protein